MTKTTAVTFVGGVVIGTVTAAATSIALWSVVPMSIWMVSTSLFGTKVVRKLT